jgi:hypothetical protein
MRRDSNGLSPLSALAASPSAGYNEYVMIVNGTGFTAVNLTILNYCNLNYEYPGNAALNLTERTIKEMPTSAGDEKR